MGGGFFEFSTADVDEAREELGDKFYANFMDVVDSDRPLRAHYRTVRLGPLTIGDLSCGADVRMRFGELGAYHVNLARTGRLDWRQGNLPTQVVSGLTAGILDPSGVTTVDRWTGECELLAVKIEADVLREQLERLLGREPRGALVFDRQFDVSAGAGHGWVRLVQRIAAEAAEPDSLIHHPLVAAPLQEALLNGLLIAAGHPYRDDLERQGTGLRPGPVKRVMDAVQERPEHPFTTSELAAIARVSARRLQESFRQYVGMSPMAYVRDVRLARVHEELRAGDPGTVSVSDAAWRWGFTHLGRFAGRYRERFGETPTQTLRSV